MIILRLLSCIALSAAAFGAAVADDVLKPPFDVAAARAAHGNAAEGGRCDAPPPPRRDLLLSGVYRAGTNNSVIDAASERSYRDARKPVDDFEKGIIRTSDRYVVSAPAENALAACVLAWLDAWASAGAMLGAVSQQGGYVRKWTLGTVSMAYLKVRDAGGLDDASKGRVVDWIRKWAAIVRDDYSTGTDRGSRNNNHSYWAGWSVMAAAVVLDDRDHFSWAMSRYRNGIGQIQEDGTLPLEMVRRTRALHYHQFAIPPLVMMAETAARNGIDLYGLRDGAIHKLIRRTLVGIDDPEYFAERAGYPQESGGGTLDAGKMAWGAAYQARFPLPALKRFLGGFDRLYDRRLGGDMTALFAVPSN